MTATTISLRLPDFETPAIPAGYELKTVEVCERGSSKRGERWRVALHHEAEAIEKACEHVVHQIGWNRAIITLWLQRDDGEEGYMRYDADRDEWTVTLADD